MEPHPVPADAFIDPDAPIVRTEPPHPPDDWEAVVRGRPGASAAPGRETGRDVPTTHSDIPEPQAMDDPTEGDAVATGIDDDPHLDDPRARAVAEYGDPPMADLVRYVGTFADELRAKGGPALKTRPGMSGFEATLRAYCVGYLAGRRHGEE